MDKEVADYAEEQGVRVFMADTIYRLVDGENAFAAYMKVSFVSYNHMRSMYW